MERRLFKPDLKIPYSEGEGYIKYEGYAFNYPELELNDFIFKDELNFEYFSRGRSSVKAHFQSKITGNLFEMFIRDVEEILLNTDQNLKELKGEFCFRKAGANFGVVLLDEIKGDN